MQKNVSGQKIGCQMVSATDGSAFTSAVTVYVTGDAGTQATGSVGSGACTHEGNGYHTYAPAQAETNYDLVAFTFIGTGAVPATMQVFTGYPQTGDSYARLGAPAGASVSTDVAAVKGDTAAVKAKTDNLPASPAAVGSAMTLAADQAVNATKIGGTTQTGRDLGASVLLSPGTGTGQLDITSGVVKANLAQILGTALTETSGYIAAAFKQFFNVASPTGTMKAITNVVTTTTATNLTNLPAAAATAAELAKVPKSDSTVSWNSTALAAINAEVDTALNTAIPGSPTANSVNERIATMDGLLLGTVAAGTHVAQSGDSYARLGAPAGASVSADVAAVKAQTAAIETDTQDLQTQVGTDGAGLTALPWNAAWDAEVQSEAADAITAAALATAANLATLAGYVDTEVAAILAAVDTEVAAIKTKTDYLPSATAGAAGGLFIAGANAATSITTALTANITGNLSGSVGSVAGAVGSVTGAVGSVTGNVGGSVASVAANGITATSIATDAINAAAIKADAVTKIQTGLATPTNITAGTITTVTNLTNLPAAAALEATLTAMKGATFSGATDSLEAIRDRGDAAWIAADISDLPTNSELATALASADDAVLAAIAALPTDADVQTAATAALNAYDPPTNAEMVARTLVAASYFDPAADTVANVTTVATTTNLTNLPAAAALEATAQAILEDTGTTLPGTLATIAGYIDTEVAAILAAVDTEVAAILADTNELQTNQGNWVTADVSALATSAELAKVPKSDGSASWNATALAAINAQADTALADYDAPTKTEMDAAFTAIKGATWNSGTDTLEALRDRGDAAWTTADVSDLPTNSELATALSGITASVDQQDIADALLLAPSGAAASGSAMDGLANILEDTGTTIPAAIAGIGGLAGSGAISFPVTINDEDSNPIDGVEVWVSTDSAGTNVVAGTLSTDALGLATFMLDAGAYYVWRQKSGYNFANPVTITVS